MSPKVRSIFLTGVTGCLGREMVRELCQTTDHRLFLLIRRKKRFSHWDRARKILADAGLEHLLGTRVHVMEGDVTQPNFGMHQYDLEILNREIEEFIHIAALTTLNGGKEECFNINLGGTENALDLARRFQREGRLDRFIYFSTAYVAGSLQTYCAKEDGLPENPSHANHYEASKYEAEKKVRQAMAEGLPVTIFRPSIVVGHSKTGEVSEFNVIYPFMKLFAHGMIKKLPAFPDNTVNIVPIDFVIQSACEIRKQENSKGRTFHLVTLTPPEIQDLLRVKDVDYMALHEIELVDPDKFCKEDLSVNEQFVFDMLQPYLGYLNGHLSFDAGNTQAALRDTGIEFPKTDFEFLRVMVKYAVDAGYLMLPTA